jgi:hypothetical protein
MSYPQHPHKRRREAHVEEVSFMLRRGGLRLGRFWRKDRILPHRRARLRHIIITLYNRPPWARS